MQSEQFRREDMLFVSIDDAQKRMRSNGLRTGCILKRRLKCIKNFSGERVDPGE